MVDAVLPVPGTPEISISHNEYIKPFDWYDLIYNL